MKPNRVRQPRITAILLLVCALGSESLAQSHAYERLRRDAAPFLGERDPFGWPYRVYSVSQSPMSFWSGGQDLFYEWCRTNANDWMSDQGAFVASQGNATPAALGMYAAKGAFGKLGFGITRFDDSCRLPFQCELLQGLVMLRLIAEQNQVDLSREQIDDLFKNFSESYLGAISSTRNATELFKDDPWVAKLLSADRPYADLIQQYTSVGQFKPVVRDSSGKAIEILRQSNEGGDIAAEVLADAVQHSPEFARQIRYATKEDFRAAIRDSAARTVLRNPISPGVHEYLVLLLRPISDLDHDLILSIKQEIPSAAERAGAIAREKGSAAERVNGNLTAMMNPACNISGFGRSGNDSYSIRLVDPWSGTLADQEIHNTDDVNHLARLWGAATGLTHRNGSDDQSIAKRANAELFAAVKSRADAYLKQMHGDFEKLQTDAVAHADAGSAKEALDAAVSP